MMLKYKVTNRISKEVIDSLLDIQKSKGLTAEKIVDEAKSSSNILHNFFDWNNSTAGYKYRLQQARVLVNEVKVIIREKEYFAFENVKVAVEMADGWEAVREYKPVIEILSNEELRKQIIKAALNHLEYWENQNSKYSELAPIISVAKIVRCKLEKKWLKIKQ